VTDFLKACEALGARPNRKELALAEEHHLLARAAVLNLQIEVQDWSIRWGSQLPIEALRELYEAIGLRKKVKL